VHTGAGSCPVALWCLLATERAAGAGGGRGKRRAKGGRHRPARASSLSLLGEETWYTPGTPLVCQVRPCYAPGMPVMPLVHLWYAFGTPWYALGMPLAGRGARQES